MFRWIAPAILILVGGVLLLGGFVFLIETGSILPTQDASPAVAAAEARNRDIGGMISLLGLLFGLSGTLAMAFVIHRHIVEKS